MACASGQVLAEFQLTPSRRATIKLALVDAVFLFQLTPSRRATEIFGIRFDSYRISTHALTEGDMTASYS